MSIEMSFLDKSPNTMPVQLLPLELSLTTSYATNPAFSSLHFDPPTPRNSTPLPSPTFSLAPCSSTTSNLTRVFSPSSQLIQEAENSAACLNSKIAALPKPQETNTKKKAGRPPTRIINNHHITSTKSLKKTENINKNLNLQTKKKEPYVTLLPQNTKRPTISSDVAFLENNREWIVKHISNENILTIECLMQCFREEGAQVQSKNVNDFLAKIGLRLPTAREYKLSQLEKHRDTIKEALKNKKFKYTQDLLLELSSLSIRTDIDSLEEFLSCMRKRKTR